MGGRLDNWRRPEIYVGFLWLGWFFNFLWGKIWLVCQVCKAQFSTWSRSALLFMGDRLDNWREPRNLRWPLAILDVYQPLRHGQNLVGNWLVLWRRAMWEPQLRGGDSTWRNEQRRLNATWVWIVRPISTSVCELDPMVWIVRPIHEAINLIPH